MIALTALTNPAGRKRACSVDMDFNIGMSAIDVLLPRMELDDGAMREFLTSSRRSNEGELVWGITRVCHDS